MATFTSRPSRCPRCGRATPVIAWWAQSGWPGSTTTSVSATISPVAAPVHGRDRVVAAAVVREPGIGLADPLRIPERGRLPLVVRGVVERVVDRCHPLDELLGHRPGPGHHRVAGRGPFGLLAQPFQPAVGQLAELQHALDLHHAWFCPGPAGEGGPAACRHASRWPAPNARGWPRGPPRAAAGRYRARAAVPPGARTGPGRPGPGSPARAVPAGTSPAPAPASRRRPGPRPARPPAGRHPSPRSSSPGKASRSAAAPPGSRPPGPPGIPRRTR